MWSQPCLQEVSSPVPGPVTYLVPRPFPGPVGCLGLGWFPCGLSPGVMVPGTVPSPIASVVPGFVPDPVARVVPSPVACVSLVRFPCGPCRFRLQIQLVLGSISSPIRCLVPSPIPGPLVMCGCTRGLGRLQLNSLSPQVPRLMFCSRLRMQVFPSSVLRLVPGLVPGTMVMRGCTRGLSRLHLRSLPPWVLHLLL